MATRIALVSRELYPFRSGGIGEFVDACARLLSSIAEVTIFTNSVHEAEYKKMRACKDDRIPERVDVVFVPETDGRDVGGFFSQLHLYSARVLTCLREYYGARGPDLVEFSDYLGEGAVTVQARRTGDSFLRHTAVAVRVHTSTEICAVLDGHTDEEFAARMTWELERLAIRDADYLIWPGGDTLEFYRRFYGLDQLAADCRIPNPSLYTAEDLDQDSRDEVGDYLHLFYLGRLERRKGVQNLVRAISFIDSEALRLDILGGDTDTAPLGTSMSRQLRMLASGDDRIRFLEAVPRTEVPDLLSPCDAVVLPSLWENWPYAGLEALRLNRPLIATPVGGFTEMVKPGISGWLTADTTTGSLVLLLERLLHAREELHRLRGKKLPMAVFKELTSSERVVAGYESLLAGRGRWDISGSGRKSSSRLESKPGAKAVAPSSSSARRGLVSIIIPYYHLAAHVEDTVWSALCQTYLATEIIIVNDGSTLDADWVLGELATKYPVTVLTQLNSGLGAARNFGISQARGSFVLPLDADDELDPTFVERALVAFRLNPTAAYVATWTRYVDERGQDLPPPEVGYQPLGNTSDEVLRNNVAGAASALMPRRLFDEFAYSEELTSYEDWHLYQQLHAAGRYGVIIPERLLRYRLRGDSMMRQIGLPARDRLSGELKARVREKEIQWTLSSA